MNRTALHAARVASSATVVLTVLIATGSVVITLAVACAMAAFLLPRVA